MIKEKYDVIVVGGGPGGSTCARILSESGLDVLVLEKKEHFDEKKIGTALVTPEGYQLIDTVFPELDNKVLSQPAEVRGPLIYYNNSLTIKSDKCQRCYNKTELDTQMLDNCKADVIKGAVFKEFITDGDEVSVLYEKDYREQKIKCSYLVSAEGFQSTIASQLFPEIIADTNKVHVRQAILIGISDFEEGYYYMLMNSNSFLNMIVPKDGKLYLIVGNDYNRNIDSTFRQMVEDIKVNHQFEGYISEILDRDVSDLWMNPITGKKKILFVGESGGIWGQADGTYYGVLTAGYCAKAILQSISEKNNNADAVYRSLLKENNVLKNVQKAHGNVVRMNKYHRTSGKGK